jgi:hypothetical protein
MTTYTVYRPFSGAVLNQGLTAVEAMYELLTYDGYRYEIRKGDFKGRACWDLWHSDGSENSPRGAFDMVKTAIHSFEEDEDKALQDIAEQVIYADNWDRAPWALTDEDHAARQAYITTLQAIRADDC